MLIGVVSHISRQGMGDSLVDRVCADLIYRDQTCPPSIAGCAGNHARVLKDLHRMATPGEWSVVLEDDAIPVENFRNELKRALLKCDGELVGLYLGTGNPSGATQQSICPAVIECLGRDASWIVAKWFISTVGYAVHSSRLASLVAALPDMSGPVDNRINEWSQTEGVETWYCQPSLVDHHDESSTITSFMPYRRQAHRFGARDDWNRRTVHMGCPDAWNHPMERQDVT